jgi:hypothetical protein
MPKSSVKTPKFLIDTNGRVYEAVAPKVKAAPVEKAVKKTKSVSTKKAVSDVVQTVIEVKKGRGKRLMNTPKEELEELWASIESLGEKEGRQLKKGLIKECNAKRAWIRVFEKLPLESVDDADKKYTSAAALIARLKGLQKTQPNNTVMMDGMKKQAEILFNDAQDLINSFSAKQRAEFQERQARNINATSFFDLRTKKDAKPVKVASVASESTADPVSETVVAMEGEVASEQPEVSSSNVEVAEIHEESTQGQTQIVTEDSVIPPSPQPEPSFGEEVTQSNE